MTLDIPFRLSPHEQIPSSATRNAGPTAAGVYVIRPLSEAKGEGGKPFRANRQDVKKPLSSLKYLLAVALLASAGCTAVAVPPAATTTPVPVVAKTAIPTPTATATPRKAWGKITVSYDKSKKKKYQRIAKELKENGAYERLAQLFTETYKLPADLPIRFTELGEENAYYDPDTNEITVGYELIDYYSKIFEIDKKDPDAYQQELVDAGYFTVCHELGHALVALLDLPITGSEEDAVDEFATISLIKMDDEQSELALISGIEQFSVDADDYESLEQLSFTDEHSFDRQRFYDVLALVYGSDPERHADLLNEDYLPEEMAEQSEWEYHRKVEVWDRLLAPHLKNPPPPEATPTPDASAAVEETPSE